MDLPTDVEEILSDDYEEGEILDGDNLYDEVSSLEEFSSDDELSQLKNSNQETQKHDSVLEKLNQNTKHRRKDHKCKENSVCRKERKAKHCYARIRKAKSSTKHKTATEATTQSTVERVFPRKPDPMPVKHLKSRPVSPYKARPDPPPKIPHRLDYKDYHEKENRHNNKRFWANPPRNNKMKPPDKHVHYNRNKVNKDSHYSKLRYHPLTPPPPKVTSVEVPKTDTTKSDNSFNKTSLLKRLVGSGTTGVKPIKDNESSLVSPKPDAVDSSDIPASKSEENLNGSSENNNEIENISILKEKPEENEKIEVLSEPHKKIEVKWIRSMKEDKDELHLRVEALKSAWLKKFNDRKKKGLIHQKKSDDSDDFLEDFALGSDSEEEKDDVTAPTKTNDSASGNALNVLHFNATDISGDILKPEDMVIVNDKPAEETIISETPVATTEVNSSVFIDPLFFSVGQYSQNTNICQVSNSNCSLPASNLITTAVVSSDTLAKNKNNRKSSVSYKSSKHKQTTSDQNLSENDRFSLSSNKSKSKKSRWRKRRRSKGNIVDTPKSVDASNMSADLDEDELRELALLSVRRKNKTKSSEASKDAANNKNNPQSSIDPGVLQVSNTPVDKVPTSLGESESTGAGSGDNWEDDLDVDILRAKLLSSLTKQISEENVKLERVTAIQEPDVVNERVVDNRIFKPVVNIMKLNSPKKQVMKKIDKRKLRNILNKKVWKQGFSPVRKARQDVRISINHFVKHEVLKKSDSSMTNNGPSMRPIPQVAQMIIKLDDSDSSSDLEISNSELVEPLPELDFVPPEIEANIDLLLREAKLNSQLEKVAKDSSSVAKQLDCEEKRKLPENPTPSDQCVPANMAVQPEIKRPKAKTPTSSPSSSSSCSSVKTPQVLKHLSAWQQEEYKRLKKKIAEKEKVLQVTRSKIIDPSKDTNVLQTISSEGKNPTVFDSVLVTSSSNTISQSNSSTSLSIAGNSPSPTTTNVETVINNIGVVGKPVKVESSPSASDSLESNKILSSKALPKVDNPCSLEDTSVAKKGFPNLVSCTIMEEINLMNDIVNDFDKNNSEYTDLKQKTARLKRILKATELKMAVKKKTMFQIRDTLTEKERQISSKIAIMANTTQADTNKLPSRDMEMVKLKYKEVSLRAQFLFHNFLSEKILANNNNGDKKSAGSIVKPESKNKEISSMGIKRTLISKESTPLKKKLTVKDPTVVAKNVLQDNAKDHTEDPLKRTFSGKEREREEWDPNTPVCHYDLHGICRDEECQYQHFKTV